MAIRPIDRYPSQTDGTDPAYPHGKAKNVNSPGDNTGTPWEKDLVNDWLGFLQSLLSAAGVSPSGTPDKVGASQYLSALRAVARVSASSLRLALENPASPPTFPSAPEACGYCDTFGQWWGLDLTGGGAFVNDGNGWVASTPVTVSGATNVTSAWGGGACLVAFDPPSATATRLVRSSDGGATWATQSLPPSYDGSTSVAWTGTHFLAVQADGATFRSTSGTTGTWTAAGTLPGGVTHTNFRQVATNGSVFIGSTGSTGTIVRTADHGVTFTSVTPPGSTNVGGVTYDPFSGLFYACGEASGAPAVWRSTDGNSWASVGPLVFVADQSPGAYAARIKFCGSSFVASFGVSGKTKTSTDGVTWTGGVFTPASVAHAQYHSAGGRIVSLGFGVTGLYLSGPA